MERLRKHDARWMMMTRMTMVGKREMCWWIRTECSLRHQYQARSHLDLEYVVALCALVCG